MKNKKFLLALSTLAAVASPIAAVVSCGKEQTKKAEAQTPKAPAQAPAGNGVASNSQSAFEDLVKNKDEIISLKNSLDGLKEYFGRELDTTNKNKAGRAAIKALNLSREILEQIKAHENFDNSKFVQGISDIKNTITELEAAKKAIEDRKNAAANPVTTHQDNSNTGTGTSQQGTHEQVGNHETEHQEVQGSSATILQRINDAPSISLEANAQLPVNNEKLKTLIRDIANDFVTRGVFAESAELKTFLLNEIKIADRQSNNQIVGEKLKEVISKIKDIYTLLNAGNKAAAIQSINGADGLSLHVGGTPVAATTQTTASTTSTTSTTSTSNTMTVRPGEKAEDAIRRYLQGVNDIDQHNPQAPHYRPGSIDYIAGTINLIAQVLQEHHVPNDAISIAYATETQDLNVLYTLPLGSQAKADALRSIAEEFIRFANNPNVQYRRVVGVSGPASSTQAPAKSAIDTLNELLDGVDDIDKNNINHPQHDANAIDYIGEMSKLLSKIDLENHVSAQDATIAFQVENEDMAIIYKMPLGSKAKADALRKVAQAFIKFAQNPSVGYQRVLSQADLDKANAAVSSSSTSTTTEQPAPQIPPIQIIKGMTTVMNDESATQALNAINKIIEAADWVNKEAIKTAFLADWAKINKDLEDDPMLGMFVASQKRLTILKQFIAIVEGTSHEYASITLGKTLFVNALEVNNPQSNPQPEPQLQGNVHENVPQPAITAPEIGQTDAAAAVPSELIIKTAEEKLRNITPLSTDEALNDNIDIFTQLVNAFTSETEKEKALRELEEFKSKDSESLTTRSTNLYNMIKNALKFIKGESNTYELVLVPALPAEASMSTGSIQDIYN